MEKRKLTVEEQVAHLKDKGVQFTIMDEAAAMTYLRKNSNYFKVASYRKNYQQHPGGPKMGQYVRLEFAYLVDLAKIDRTLRYQIVQMSLDIEHHVKLQILRLVDESDEDGYAIIRDFEAQLNDNQRDILCNEIERNRNNPYCGDLVRKYGEDMPVWVFVELIPFGRLISLYKFCGERFGIREMQRNYYRLRDCRELRNAAAHSNCVLNELRSGQSRKTNEAVSEALDQIEELPLSLKRSRMSNERIRQVITLLYVYKSQVTSISMQERASRRLQDLIARIYKHENYYKDNPLIGHSFAFFKIVIDNWFGIK